MGKILCATRGGEPSYRTQNAAIELAKERDDTLLFLYVVDLEFLDKMAEAGVLNTEQELTRVGRGLLLATARAAEQGVGAETIIRTGEMREEVKNTACKEGVSLVVLGQPAGEESVFDLAGAEVSALLGRVLSAVGYQPTLDSEMAMLQERITTTSRGSATSVQAIYVPAQGRRTD